MDVVHYTLPPDADVAVIVGETGEPPLLECARTVEVARSGIGEPGALVRRLCELRDSDQVEFLLVPHASLGWLDSRPELASALHSAFEPVGRSDSAGALYSLHQRRGAGGIGPDDLPLPPVHLVRITSGCVRQARTNPVQMYRSFLASGETGSRSIREIVGRAGVDLGTLEAILDFGCGCGRVVRHWRGLAGTQVHGSDYNPHLVEWCTANLPFAEFGVNGPAPPLSYEDDKFDLVYSLSVFTHLDATLQRPWIEELARVTRPGGLVLISLRARSGHNVMNSDERERFERGELVVRRSDLSGRNDCNVYHPIRYIREELTRGFELIELAMAGAADVRQDALLIRIPG